MLTEQELDTALETLMKRLDEVNKFYIAKIAAQIKKIGELSQSSINRLVIMAEMGTDVAEITQRLQIATSQNTADLFKIYQKALTDTYTDQRFTRMVTQAPISQEAQDRLTHYTQTVAVQTAQTMQNLSNTTAISEPYRQAVDKAIYAVTSGADSYQSATRQIIRDLGYNGMQVQYESGYHRRLDTAVRQNVVDGANQIAQNGSILMGEELGYDAYEISAHARSAPDHEPVQGRVFLKAEFEKMQAGQSFVDVDGNHYAGFRRPIGEWNCMHIAMSFSTQHSVRRYTDQQLADWKKANNQGCTIDGKHYTIYQVTQIMRQLETEVRREKDAANAARQAGNDLARQDCQRRINALAAKYSQVAQTSGLTPHKERMVVEGFRAVKVK